MEYCQTYFINFLLIFCFISYISGTANSAAADGVGALRSATKSEIEKYMVQKPCSSCGGARLKKEALAVTVGGINIHEACQLSIEKLYEFIEN